jgi:hypothetical protein
MLTIERTRVATHDIGRLPLLTRIGALMLPVAVVFDVVVHVAAGEHTGHSGIEHLAHLLGIVGMVLVLMGVVADGVRRQFDRRRPAANRRYS